MVKSSNKHVIEVSEEIRQNQYLKRYCLKNFKTDGNHQARDLRISANPKQDKYNENHH